MCVKMRRPLSIAGNSFSKIRGLTVYVEIVVEGMAVVKKTSNFY